MQGAETRTVRCPFGIKLPDFGLVANLLSSATPPSVSHEYFLHRTTRELKGDEIQVLQTMPGML